MRAGPLTGCLPFAFALLAGCGSRPAASDETTVRVVRAASQPTPTPSPTTSPVPAPVATHPAPLPTSLAEMRPRKTFVDPPLPPELLQFQDPHPRRPQPTGQAN